MKTLEKSGLQEDAETVEVTIQEVQPDAALVEEDIQIAEEALSKWRTLKAGQAKLAHAMKEGQNSATLSRALQASHPTSEPPPLHPKRMRYYSSPMQCFVSLNMFTKVCTQTAKG